MFFFNSLWALLTLTCWDFRVISISDGSSLTMVISIVFILNADSKIFKEHRFIVKSQFHSSSNLPIPQFSREHYYQLIEFPSYSKHIWMYISKNLNGSIPYTLLLLLHTAPYFFPFNNVSYRLLHISMH